MKKLLFTFTLFLFTSLVWAASEFSIPVTITSGNSTTASFNVPDNKTGVFSFKIPCDPAWALQIGFQYSLDNGKTWDCDMVKIPCQGYSRPATSCAAKDKGFTGGIFAVDKGVLNPKTKMRVGFISSLTKTVTVVITFDPI